MLVVVLPVLLWPLLPWRRPRWVDFLPGTAVILLIIQLVAEGYRWQMLPAYGLVVALFLLTLPRLRSTPSPEKKWSGWAIAGGVLGLAVWLAAWALPYLLPVPRLPDPTGPYAIGTQTFYLVDESRSEIYTDDPADKREIMMQVWYPAEPDAEGETAVYLADLDVMGPALAERLDLPSFLLNHVNLAKMDILKETPLLAADAPYPVLLFSHGLGGIRAQNMAVVRDLVSNGFVVAAIDHTYANAITVFPDGRVVFYNPDVLSGAGDPPHTSNTLVGVWADDIGFVLDEMAAWNEEEGGAFNGRFDLSRIGVFGHSTGGGAAVEFCGRDERCRAGVGLDAWVVPVSDDIVAAGLSQPFLFLRAAEWEFDDAAQNKAIAESLFATLPGAGYLATVDGAAHFDFTDLPLFSPLTLQLGLSSDMDSEYVVGMTNRMTTAFFREALQGADVDLAQEAAAYREMTLVGKGEG
jgi:predicted dienelactone hydrolase